jgi:hypothetical protein
MTTANAPVPRQERRLPQRSGKRDPVWPILLLGLSVGGTAPASIRPPDLILDSATFETRGRTLETDQSPRPNVVIRGPISLSRNMAWYVRDLRFDVAGQIFLRGYTLTIDLEGSLTSEGKADFQIAGFPPGERTADGRTGPAGGASGNSKGIDGGPGEPGANGKDGGVLTLELRSLAPSFVRINLRGQDGGNGGDGGLGAAGLPGRKGEPASNGPFGCNRGGGNGLAGGAGGSGGNAGCGGNGGNGGSVYLSLRGKVSSVIQQSSVQHVDSLFAKLLPACQLGAPGKAGLNGRAGTGGLGGPGGDGGDGSGFCSGGVAGPAGTKGADGNLSCTPSDGHLGRFAIGEVP